MKSETKSRLVTINKYYIRIIKAARFVGLVAFVSDGSFFRLRLGFCEYLESPLVGLISELLIAQKLFFLKELCEFFH